MRVKLLRTINEWRRKQEYILVLITVLALTVFESRAVIFQLPNHIGQGYFKYTLMPFSLKEKFHYAPLLILDGLLLPTPYAIGLLCTFYHAIGSFSMFIFLKTYLERIFREKSSFILPSYIGMLVYMFYPWNIMGDVFPTLALMRALIPFTLLMLMKSLNNRSSFTILAGASLLALMQLADPRSVLFLVPIAFCVIVLPNLLLTSTTKGKLRPLSIYFFYIILAFALSASDILYRLAKSFGVYSIAPLPVTGISAFNVDVFRPNFTYATPLNVMRGLSFTATYNFFEGFIEKQLSTTLSLIGFGQLFVFVFAISLPLLLLIKKKDKSYRAYLMSTISMLIITILLFSRFNLEGELPILPQVVLSLTNSESPEIVKSIILMFRTTRFLNLVSMIALSLLTGITVAILFKKREGSTLKVSFTVVNEMRKHKRLISFKDAHIVTFLILINVLMWALPMVILGTGPTRPHPYFEISDQTMAYSNIVSQLKPYPATEKTVSMHPWAGGLPHPYFLHGVEAGVKQFIIRYTVDNLFSPILQEKDYEFMAEILDKLGVKYLISDGYRMNRYYINASTIERELSESISLKQVANEGKLNAFELLDTNHISISSSGLFVLGGFEDYRTIFPILQELTNNTVVPIFIDNYLDMDLLTHSSWPLLISPHKSFSDLVTSLVIGENGTIVVTPAKWTNDWNRLKNWSPGYIIDTSGGFWSYILFDLTNYEWSYSYRPDYGYAWIVNAHDSLTMNFIARNDTYSVMTRVLMSPGSGEVKFELENIFSETVRTRWDYSSSEFLWVNLGEYDLGEDSYTLTLENIEGVNAVNLVVLVPSSTLECSLNTAENFIQGRDLIYVVDGDRQLFDPFEGHIETFVNIIKESRYNAIYRSNLSDVLVAQKRRETDEINIREMNSQSSEDPSTISEGIYQLKIPFSEIVFASSFEDWNTSRGAADPWSAPEGSLYEVSLDTDTQVHGQYSYALVTNNSDPAKWSWVRSPVIPVKPKATYSISTHMKWNNTKQSHIAIDGIRLDNSTVRLTSVPYGVDGLSDWKEFKTEITIPEDVKELGIILNAGWVQNRSIGNATTWFDAILIQEVDAETNLPIILLYSSDEPLKNIFTQGSGTFNVKSNFTHVYDNAYKEYSFALHVEGPTIITIPEIFDGAWRIETNNDLEIHTVPAYYVLSGFYITSEEPQEINITIYNASHRLLRQAEYASFTTIGAIGIIYVAWNTKRLFNKKGYNLMQDLKRATFWRAGKHGKERKHSDT